MYFLIKSTGFTVCDVAWPKKPSKLINQPRERIRLVIDVTASEEAQQVPFRLLKYSEIDRFLSRIRNSNHLHFSWDTEV
jgi:hypothetical protein